MDKEKEEKNLHSKYPPGETTLGTKSYRDIKRTVEIDAHKEFAKLQEERRNKLFLNLKICSNCKSFKRVKHVNFRKRKLLKKEHNWKIIKKKLGICKTKKAYVTYDGSCPKFSNIEIQGK